jgi:hypothetical protein
MKALFDVAVLGLVPPPIAYICRSYGDAHISRQRLANHFNAITEEIPPIRCARVAEQGRGPSPARAYLQEL